VTKLAWDAIGERLYEIGIDRGVFYPKTGNGVPWNGLTAVNENPSGGEPKANYIDGYKYSNRATPEEYEAELQAFTYPPQFSECDGTASLARGLYITQQSRTSFGLSYRTRIGNDLEFDVKGYKLHLVYNLLATPSSRSYSTLTDSAEPMSFSWNLSSKPIRLTGRKPVFHMVINSTEVDAPLLTALEAVLYGTSSSEPRLPLPTEVITLFTGWPSLYVANNGNGTFTVSGPDDVVRLLDARTFQVIAPSATNDGDGSFTINSA
jgi:hypothetical protein